MVKAKPGYKLVRWYFGKEIELPEEWKIEKIKNIVKKEKKVTYGIVQPGKFDAKGILLIRGKDYISGWVTEEKFFRVDPKLHQSYIRAKTTSGDILLCIAGAGVGAVNQVPAWIKEANITQTTARISCDEKIIDSKFILYYLDSFLGKIETVRYSKGSAQPGINLDSVEKYSVLYPTLKEQQKIASVLTNVDNLISSYDNTVQTTKKLKTGLMQTLLTRGIGHKKFKKIPWYFGKEIEIPEEWDKTPLKNKSKKIGDGMHATPNYVDDSNYYFINGNNLDGGVVCFFNETKNISKEEYQKYQLDLNQDTVFLSINGTIGNVAFYNNEKIVLGKSVCYIICDESLNKKFLFYVLQAEYFQKFINRELTGTTISNLSLATVKNTPLLLPLLSEQQKIASILSAIDSKISDLKSKKSNLELLKKGLMHKLLTGQIRVMA